MWYLYGSPNNTLNRLRQKKKKKLLEFYRTGCLDFQFGRLLNVQKRTLSADTFLAMTT